MQDMRCSGGLKARLLPDGLVEVPCHSRWCGKLPGNVILHRFKPETGELVETLMFKAPQQPTNKERTA